MTVTGLIRQVLLSHSFEAMQDSQSGSLKSFKLALLPFYSRQQSAAADRQELWRIMPMGADAPRHVC